MKIYFKSKDPHFGWLSNFSNHSFVIGGREWPSVEHYYQAQKYDSAEIQEAIWSAETPLKARKAGRNSSLSPREGWDEAKVGVMRTALHAKFSQNRTVARMLAETEEADLIHESSSDQYWGQNRDGAGENILGKLLMEVREQISKS